MRACFVGLRHRSESARATKRAQRISSPALDNSSASAGSSRPVSGSALSNLMDADG
jgi:hypothetical protein